MMRSLIMVAALLASTGAIAADVPMAATVPVEGDKAAEDKPICRTERSLSSRVVKRICKTSAQRQQEELEARNKVRLGSGRKGQPSEAFKLPGE
jgi:hypothetical protein